LTTLTKKQHIGQLVDPGDFCFVEDQIRKFVIMACPICAGLFVCKHEIKNENPLTLSPSVVGPEETWRIEEQVLAPCLHHFFVTNGEVINAS
jgi:hypothetical protein